MIFPMNVVWCSRLHQTCTYRSARCQLRIGTCIPSPKFSHYLILQVTPRISTLPWEGLNNSVLPALHVPGSEEPLVVSDNNSVKFLDVSVRTREDTLPGCGILELDHNINHCKQALKDRELCAAIK